MVPSVAPISPMTQPIERLAQLLRNLFNGQWWRKAKVRSGIRRANRLGVLARYSSVAVPICWIGHGSQRCCIEGLVTIRQADN